MSCELTENSILDIALVLPRKILFLTLSDISTLQQNYKTTLIIIIIIINLVYHFFFFFLFFFFCFVFFKLDGYCKNILKPYSLR